MYVVVVVDCLGFQRRNSLRFQFNIYSTFKLHSYRFSYLRHKSSTVVKWNCAILRLNPKSFAKQISATSVSNTQPIANVTSIYVAYYLYNLCYNSCKLKISYFAQKTAQSLRG